MSGFKLPGKPMRPYLKCPAYIKKYLKKIIKQENKGEVHNGRKRA